MFSSHTVGAPPAKARTIAYFALFTALIAIGAFIRIPTPVCPFTLQLLFTTLAGLVMGPRRGAGAVTLYVLLGLVGVPVFTAGGGPAYVFQPTFGYLIGFIVGAWLVGVLAGDHTTWTWRKLLFAVFANLVVVYAFGVSYTYVIVNYYLSTVSGLWGLFLYAFAAGVPGDVLVCLLTVYIARRLRTSGIIL